MQPMQGFQNYQPPPVEAGAVGEMLGGDGEAPSEMAPGPQAGPTGASEHSPESTEHALRFAVGMMLSGPKKVHNVPGTHSLRQLRQLGVPESEIVIDRASGLVEGDD